MCADFKQILNVRRIDCRPSRYFTRRSGICIIGVSASYADKFRLAFTVSSIDTPTLRTSPGCVARIDEPNRDTCSLGFIQDKALHLIKAPAVQTAALRSLSPYPSANPFEIFHRDTAPGAFGSTNYFLRNYVIHVASESLLFAATAAQQTLRGLRAFLLQLAAQTNIARSFAGDGRARESRAIASLGDRHESHINADPAEHLAFFLIGHVNRREEEPFLVAINQIRFTTLEAKQFLMVIAADKRDLGATVECPDVRNAFLHVPRQNARIVRDRAVLAELAADLAVKLVSVRHLGVEPNDNLSGQREFVADRSIAKPVQRVLTKLFRVPSELAQSIARDIRCLQRAQERGRLFWSGLQFHLCSEFNSCSQYSSIEHTQLTKNGIPLSAKADSLLPKTL